MTATGATGSAVWRAERLKLRHSFLPHLVWGLPLLGLLCFLLIAGLGTNVARGWSSLPGLGYNSWTFLVLPLGAALLAGLDTLLEKRAGYGGLLYRPVAPARSLLSRFAVLAEVLLWAHLVFALAVILAAALLGARGPVPVARLAGLAVLPWLTALPLLALGLAVARCWGWVAGLLLGGAGLWTGALAETGTWWVTPWAWAVRASLPLSGTHANGLLLSPASPLWHLSLVPPVLLALAGTGLGLWWAGRTAGEG